MFIKTKWKGAVVEKKLQNFAIISSRHKMAKYIGKIETDCDLSNLKKHLQRYLTTKATMSMMRIKLIMRSWKSKSENQPSPKTAVRTTLYGRVVKPPKKYDEYESH